MINIFNLFLVLFFCWMMLIFSGNMMSLSYIAIGIFASAIVSLVSWRMGVINKSSRFLFLHLGFVKHFSILFTVSLIKSIFLLIKYSLVKSSLDPVIYHLPMRGRREGNQTLLIATLSLVPGVMAISFKSDQLIIHALNHNVLIGSRIDMLYESVNKINDDSLV